MMGQGFYQDGIAGFDMAGFSERRVTVDERLSVSISDGGVSVLSPGSTFTPFLEQEADGLYRQQKAKLALTKPVADMTTAELRETARLAAEAFHVAATKRIEAMEARRRQQEGS